MHYFKRSVVYELEIDSPLNCLKNLDNKSESYGQMKEWKRLDRALFDIELPRETLVLAEKCTEYRGAVSHLLS